MLASNPSSPEWLDICAALKPLLHPQTGQWTDMQLLRQLGLDAQWYFWLNVGPALGDPDDPAVTQKLREFVDQARAGTIKPMLPKPSEIFEQFESRHLRTFHGAGVHMFWLDRGGRKEVDGWQFMMAFRESNCKLPASYDELPQMVKAAIQELFAQLREADPPVHLGPEDIIITGGVRML